MNDRTRSRDDRDERGGGRGRDEPQRRSLRGDDARGGRDDRGGTRDRGDDRGSRGGREERNVRSGSRSFTYRERTGESLKKRAAMGNTDFDKILKDGVKMWAPKDGPNTIRILPATWDDAEHFGLDVHVHYNIGPDKQSYLCPVQMNVGDYCPICEERAVALKDGDTDYAKDLATRRRVLVYIIDRDAEREGLQAWAMPQSIDQDLAKVGQDRRTGAVLPIDHPYDGYDIEFDKEGKGINTKYKGLAIARNSSELGNDRWLDEAEAAPLPTLLDVHDPEYIAKVFGGGSSSGSPKHDDEARGDRSYRRDQSSESTGRRDASRDDDRAERGRGAERAAAPKDDPTWEEVHEMSSNDLDLLAERECPNIDPARFSTDEDLADAICEDMGIPKPRARAEPERGGRSRLADMRGR